jgi:hypothetical protein
MLLSDYPSNERQIPWKPVVIIAVAVVFVIVGIIVLARVFGDNDHVSIQNVNVVETLMDECETAQDKEKCQSQKVTKAASILGEADGCDLLESDEERDNCVWTVAMERRDLQMCARVSNEEWRSKCEDGIAQELAFEKKDESYCDKIKNSRRAQRCKAILNEKTDAVDTDVDGLTDNEEIEYGTDFENPDSDGDGYKDGEEVRAGYNPLGAGRL